MVRLRVRASTFQKKKALQQDRFSGRLILTQPNSPDKIYFIFTSLLNGALSLWLQSMRLF